MRRGTPTETVIPAIGATIPLPQSPTRSQKNSHQYRSLMTTQSAILLLWMPHDEARGKSTNQRPSPASFATATEQGARQAHLRLTRIRKTPYRTIRTTRDVAHLHNRQDHRSPKGAIGTTTRRVGVSREMVRLPRDGVDLGAYACDSSASCALVLPAEKPFDAEQH